MFFAQLKALVWKNIQLRKRHKIRCLIEFLWPSLLTIILLWLRLKKQPTNVGECYFTQRSLPSVGTFAFIQSAICSIDNVCHHYVNDTRVKTGSISSSDLAELLSTAQGFLKMEDNFEELNQFLQSINTSVAENRSVYNDLLERVISSVNSNDFSQTESNSITSKIFYDSYSSIKELLRLQTITNNLDHYESKFIEFIQTLSVATKKTNGYLYRLEDLKGYSLFQKNVLTLYKLLCGDQSSNFLNAILYNENIKSWANENLSSKSTVKKIRKRSNEVNESRTNMTCDEYFSFFDKDNTLTWVWWMLKPFVRGKLFYAPSTPATDRIMNKFQKAFTFWKENSRLFLNEIIPAIVKISNPTSLRSIEEFENSSLGKFISANLEIKTLNSFLVVMKEVFTLKQKLTSLKATFISTDDFLQCVDFDKVKGFSTEEDALKAAKPLHEENSLLALIVFINPGNESLNPRVSYKIRMDEQRVDDTFYTQDSLWNQKPRIEPTWDEKYIKYGFAYIQDMLDNFIIEEQTQKTDIPGIILQEFPFPCYVKDSFNEQIGFMFPLIMVLSWSFTCAMIAKSIVYEKEKRLKETMKMMGLGSIVHWFGWFIDSFFFMQLSICLLTIMLKYGNILEDISLTLLFTFLTLYGCSTISLAFLISTIFSRANISAAAGGILFFALYIPYPVMEKWASYFSSAEKCLISLSSNVAFGVGSSYLAQYAERGISITWDNVFESPVNGDNFNIAYVMIMLIIDIFIYFFIALYIDAVFPGQYGIPKPWYFPFIRNPMKRWDDEANGSLHETNSSNFETEPQDLILGVSIKNLGLVYNNGKVAVSGLKLNFYEDQITSLLGHNGAGKTSTISVLTGLYPPSSGTVSIYEHDLLSSMEKIRGKLGICPQHNIIFDLLTVEEHLWFYSQLRCQTIAKAKLEVELMIKDIGLSNHRSVLAINLSGGMQRKLSVAAALIGGPKIVILDEPTSSVDPYSRRAIWDLLIKYRKGRTIILTTHSMDEAEMLSDRIAIMVNGHVECCGTSLFLKDQFGSGFRLTVELKNNRFNEDKFKALETNTTELTKHVVEIIPSAILIEQKDCSLSFTIPNRNDCKALQRLFSMLEEKKDLLSIYSYNVSDSSLEEIFLHVTERADPPSPQQSNNSDKIHPIKETKRKTHFKLWSWSHLCALFVKRYHHTRRNKKAIFAELFLPPVFIYIAIFATSLEPSVEPRPVLALNPWIYDSPRYIFYDDNSTNLTTWNTVLREVFGAEGLGTRCLSEYRDKNCLSSVNMTWYEQPAPNIEDFGPDCACKTEVPICPAEDAKHFPPSTQVVSGDTMFDLSGSNVSNFLVKTYNKYDRSLFGGYSFGIPPPISVSAVDYSTFINQSVVSVLNQTLSSSALNVKVWYNNKAWASSVAYVNAIKNVFLRSLIPSDNASRYGIDAFNHPMPYTEKQKVLFTIDKQQTAVFHAIALLFALSFVPASFTAYLVEERASGSKHLQLVSGLSKPMYWLHIISWDLACYALSTTFCIVSFLLLQEQAYISSSNFFGLASLLYIYGFACTSLMYPLSFLYSEPSTAYVATACGNMFISTSTMITTILLDNFKDKELSAISDFLEKIFIVFPHFALGNGIQKLVYSHLTFIYNSVIDATPPTRPNIFAWDFLGKNLVAMTVVGCFFFLTLFLLEYKFFKRLHNLRPQKGYAYSPMDVDDDEDVVSERKRINEGDIGDDVLVIKDLCKMYKRNGSLQAVVNHLSLGIRRGECFGLLGLNGAGKTVTLKMLSGKIHPSFGDAMINGWNVSTDLKMVQSLIGYCPQFDALDNLLTPKEHLDFYAKIRNIPNFDIEKTVAKSLDTFGLVGYKDCTAGTLSGGNKRKLSNAIAVMGKPPLLLLDEPTSGMDPKSRRFLRTCIKGLVHQGHSIILTSHSMEECQELCTRLTVMVNGQFKCLGSPHYLKNKYGKGYSLILNCKQDALKAVKNIVETELPSSILAEEKLSHLSYQLPKQTVQLDQVFQTIEGVRNYLKDFSVCQTTLEEVFITLASKQTSKSKSKKGLFTRLFRNISRKFNNTGSLDIST